MEDEGVNSAKDPINGWIFGRREQCWNSVRLMGLRETA